MDLQFNCEFQTRPLVDLSYQSSDEDMDIDSINSAEDVQDIVSEEDDIQVLACYRYNKEFPPQLTAGRAMTTELAECLNDLNIPLSEPVDSVSTFSEPSNSLIEWFVGNPPSSYHGQSTSDRPLVQCSGLDPVLESPISPPLIDQRPTYDHPQETVTPIHEENWTHNPHITGLGISVSGYCGQPNEVFHTGLLYAEKITRRSRKKSPSAI